MRKMSEGKSLSGMEKIKRGPLCAAVHDAGMKVPLPFPHSISSHEVLIELAKAIRFFLRAAPQMTLGTETQEFQWSEIDFPAELLTGADVGLRRRLNARSQDGTAHWLHWRQTIGNDPLGYLLEIALKMGVAQGIRQVFNSPQFALQNVSAE